MFSVASNEFIMGAESVLAWPVGPGWKSSQAGRLSWISNKTFFLTMNKKEPILVTDNILITDNNDFSQ